MAAVGGCCEVDVSTAAYYIRFFKKDSSVENNLKS
jgi:hypothetical protein